jgi:hypothetical protein
VDSAAENNTTINVYDNVEAIQLLDKIVGCYEDFKEQTP